MRSFLFGVLSWIWFASSAVNAQNCNCRVNTLPDLDVVLNIGPAAIAQCEALLDPTFCSLLTVIDGFSCGEVQFNPTLANGIFPLPQTLLKPPPPMGKCRSAQAILEI